MPKPPVQRRDDGSIAGFDRLSDPAPVSDTELSVSRRRLAEAVPSAWLDRLLVAAIDLPLQGGERAVVEALVDSVAAIVPSHAMGACWVPESGGTRRERAAVLRLPGGAPADRASGVDPARMFPSLAHEYIVAIPSNSTGSTLHLASDDDDLEADSPAVHLVDRAAVVLGRALAHARAAAVAAAAGGQRSVRQFEKRMIQADKLATFGQLAAGVVHELNNPLTSIVAYSDYLIRKAEGNGGIREGDDVERLRRIHESANRMLRFTRELVSYTRPSSGSAAPVALHDALDQAVAFCEHVLSAAGVRVERRYAREGLTVRGVSEQLVQVFVNLLTNACQAAPVSGGRVALSTRLETNASTRKIVVVVADNGAGIAPEHVAHVFVPFFTTKRDRNGTGLGLSIVKNIVEGHDGEIRVASHRGRGTEFVIEFPA
jgi:two-component system NtrC family sensor kinase